jgi:DNA replication protein DnaC
MPGIGIISPQYLHHGKKEVEMVKIDETIRKYAAGIKVEKNEEKEESPFDTKLQYSGDPNCPICHGIGFCSRDLPITDPDFGKVEICICRQQEVMRNAHRRIYQFANLEALRQYSFDTFKPEGKDGTLTTEEELSLNSGYKRCFNFASNLDGWLLITGQNGCGKTHLAAAIANQAVAVGVPTLFLTVPDLLDWMRFAYSDPETTFEHRFEEIRNIQLLIMDDFGTENATPWAQEKLFQILNYRYINHLPVVITTNREIDTIEKRIQSRLQDPELVQHIMIKAPDYRNPKAMGVHSELSSLSLHSKRTFDTFDNRTNESISKDLQNNIEHAYQTALKYAKKPVGWLIITGTYGTGKTHLAAAIGNYQSNLGLSPLFVNIPDLMDHLRATFHPESHETYDQRFEEIRSSHLLILDDLSGQNTTPWVREKLYQLFNFRYYSELPTVVTTSEEINKLDERLQSRILDKRLCKVISIQGPAYFHLNDILTKPIAKGSFQKGKVPGT